MSTIGSGSTVNLEPRAVEAGRGAGWIGDGFGLFKKDAGIWVAIVVIWLIALLVIGLVPFLGSLVTNLFMPVILGGLMLGCQAQDRGERLKIEHLWAGFSHPAFTQLLLLGVAYLVLGIVVALLGFGIVFASFGSAILNGGGYGHSADGLGIGALFSVLLIVVLLFAVTMATWLAPQCIVLGGMSTIDAMKASFIASLRNVPTLLVYGLLAILLVIIAAIPLFLGLLVATPVLMAASYVAWRDLYGPVTGTTIVEPLLPQ